MTEPLYHVRSMQWNDWLGRSTKLVTWEGSATRAGAWPLDEANKLAGQHGGYIERVTDTSNEDRPRE